METLLVNLAGLAAIAWIVWYFFLTRREERAEARTADGVQEAVVTVRGGYIPDTTLARPGLPLRLHFRREETSACSEEVVFPDFGIRRHLPPFETTVIELPAAAAGTYNFACGMDMLHGRVVLAESAPAAEAGTGPAHVAAQSAPPPAPVAALPHPRAMPMAQAASPGPAAADSSAWPVDPICGMRVDPARPAGISERDGTTFYFCGLGCKTRFDAGGGPRPMAPSGGEQRVTLGVRRRPS